LNHGNPDNDDWLVSGTVAIVVIGVIKTVACAEKETTDGEYSRQSQ
jgi:hypothetical protein